MKIDLRLNKDLKDKLTEYFSVVCSKHDFIDMELLKLMVQITNKTGLQVDVLINRKGVVKDIFVSEKERVDFSALDKVDGGLNGIRLIHTVPRGDSNLTALDKVNLTNYKFDCVCAIGTSITGMVGAHVGYPNGKDMDIVYVPNVLYINKYGLLEKIEKYDFKEKRQPINMFNGYVRQQRAVLVMAEIEKDDDIVTDLKELEGLATTAGILVVNKIWQKRTKPDPKYMIGEGKLDEVARAVKLDGADLVIFDNALNGSKINNLELALGVKVIDRSMLILDIFAMRAETSEGKLQVELAQLKNSLPRLSGLIETDGRFGGGVGMRGPGETKLELNKRVVLEKIQKLEKQLRTVKKTREINRQSRKFSKKKTVAIVGYTNSGKSTLMNLLTREKLYAKDELFATLDTTTRNLWLDYNKEVLLVDTVGFINKLPHEFIDAFSSTLEETKYADLLLNVVDLSDPNYKKHMQVVEAVLKKIGAKAPVLTVFNKIDLLPGFVEVPGMKNENTVYISAEEGINIDELKLKIINFIKNK